MVSTSYLIQFQQALHRRNIHSSVFQVYLFDDLTYSGEIYLLFSILDHVNIIAFCGQNPRDSAYTFAGFQVDIKTQKFMPEKCIVFTGKGLFFYEDLSK